MGVRRSPLGAVPEALSVAVTRGPAAKRNRSPLLVLTYGVFPCTSNSARSSPPPSE